MNRVLMGLCPLLLAMPCTASEDSYYDLGDFRRTVAATNESAATWFQRGFTQCYGFNHEEAIRCFEKAIQIEPALAMAHWGIAYALGPNYNNPVVEEPAAERANAAADEALRHIEHASAVEQALIHALRTRYEWPVTEDRTHLENAYAEAMRGVHAAFPDDPDVAALFAESLMMVHPWQLWSPDGEPSPVTPECRTVIESALARWPDHPALCHLYIHLMEPSPDPGVALAAADRLRDRVPQAGHLVHMPSHIDVLVGDYAAVIEANRRGIEADRLFVEREGRLNFYTLYRLHNYHFLVYGAMFDGQRELAMSAAEELVREIPPELLAEIPDFIEAFVPTPVHVLVRFGRWDDILALSPPPADQPFSVAIWRYARTIAYAAKGDVPNAEAEYTALLPAAEAVPESRLMFNNTCRDIMKVAVAMAKGEVEYRRGEFDLAFASLREAVALDDALNYDEPWGWMQPARHALGALLLEQGHTAEAEAVYRADLKRHPKNGWALHGLAEALRKTGRGEEAVSCEAQLAGAWSRSDTPLTTSCFCRTGKFAKR